MRKFWSKWFFQFISYDWQFVVRCDKNLKVWFCMLWTNDIVLFAMNRYFWLCFVDWSIKLSADKTSLNDYSMFCFITCSKSIFETVVELIKITFLNRWSEFVNVDVNTLIVIFRFVVCFFIFLHCFWITDKNCLYFFYV